MATVDGTQEVRVGTAGEAAGTDLLGPESGRTLRATQEQGFSVWGDGPGPAMSGEAREELGDCAFPARDGGGSGSGERCVL